MAEQSSNQQVYLIRHGETEWSRTGRHTGRSDIPLTETGKEQAEFLRPIFEGVRFVKILSSPLQRALATAHLAGLVDRVETTDDLTEWDYGDYEGITTKEIRKSVPDWTVWTHPCPNGETIEQVAARADRVVQKVREVKGDVGLFSHGHFLRVLAARWLGMDPAAGKHLVLDTSTLSILSYEHEDPALKTWNGPLVTAACAVPWTEASAAR
ncbi:MAG: histidine phosphatase family protein [Verrucomicrobia bacterium]|nr:histidine phosphatase family protein [Verrucomicrobiota bacterium]